MKQVLSQRSLWETFYKQVLIGGVNQHKFQSSMPKNMEAESLMVQECPSFRREKEQMYLTLHFIFSWPLGNCMCQCLLIINTGLPATSISINIIKFMPSINHPRLHQHYFFLFKGTVIKIKYRPYSGRILLLVIHLRWISYSVCINN